MSIQIKVLQDNKSINGFATSNLQLKITGKDINYIIINTLRRVAYSLVGAYAFDPQYMTIEKNTSIYNNDYMRSRISNFPIIDTDNILHNNDDLLDTFLKLEVDANKSIFEIQKNNLQELEEIEIKKKEMIDNLHIYIKAKNNTDDIMNVTTNAEYTTFYLGEKAIPDIYPRELLIIKLKPGEEFACYSIANLNIPMYHNIFSSCTIFSYEEIDDNEFNVYIESRRQITEKDIIKKCCKLICKKLINLKNIIISKIEGNTEAEYEAEIKIENENHTLGNLITRGIQDHKNISFCGYKIDHPDINELTIKYKTEGDKFSNILKQIIKKQIEIYEMIDSKI